MFAVALLTLGASVASHADSSLTNRRDKALEGIKACLHRNEVASRECKHLNQNVETLVEVYRSGDKSVLPTLFRFTYLTDFYGEALLSDPEGFLSAVTELPEREQREVADGIAGRHFKPLEKARFEAVRAVLTGVPESSPTSRVAQLCLKKLETNNASLFLNYFPPQTFTSRGANFRIFWFSRDLYAMEEKPLWPPSSSPHTTYRFTYLGAFGGKKVVTLTASTDDKASVRIKVMHASHDAMETDNTLTVEPDKIANFSTALAKVDFWNMQPEESEIGSTLRSDGAEWMLEGVQNGEYHIVARWCPATQSHSPQSLAFADAARLLLEFAGYKNKGNC